MVVTLEQVTVDALALTPKDRERLLDRIYKSLAATEVSAPLGADWDEVKRRVEEIDHGVETISAVEVFAKLRGKHG